MTTLDQTISYILALFYTYSIAIYKDRLTMLFKALRLGVSVNCIESQKTLKSNTVLISDKGHTNGLRLIVVKCGIRITQMEKRAIFSFSLSGANIATIVISPTAIQDLMYQKED